MSRGRTERIARRYFVRGRVQGVGYRDFAQRSARQAGVAGYARNLDDGSVEVYAVGAAAQLDELAGYLRRGPMWADVRHMEELEAAVEKCASFEIKT